MADLLLKNHAPDGQGLVHRVTPESAGWGHVGFELYRLEPGQGLEAATGGREACLVLVGGKARVRAGGRDLGEIGDRMPAGGTRRRAGARAGQCAPVSRGVPGGHRRAPRRASDRRDPKGTIGRGSRRGGQATRHRIAIELVLALTRFHAQRPRAGTWAEPRRRVGHREEPPTAMIEKLLRGLVAACAPSTNSAPTGEGAA